MNKKNLWLFALLAVAGAISLSLANLVFVSPSVKQLSGFCNGIGAAAFCLGIGNFVGAIITSKTETPEALRRKNIEVNDERNTRIREKVGAKINQIMIYVLSALVLALGFMGAELYIILLIAALFVLELILAIVLTDYYSKQI